MNYESWQRYLYFSFEKEQTAPSGRRYFIFQDDSGIAKRARLSHVDQNFEYQSGARGPFCAK